MHYNVKDAMRNGINPPKNSQKIKNIFQPNIKVYQSPSQQSNNLIYNNNNNDFKNYNIRVNKAKNAPKEKIIEGDLYFNNKSTNHEKIPNNQKPKKTRGKPTKSPVPIPKGYKPSNYQKLFSNFRPLNSNILKPKSAMPRKNHFMNNINSNINKNVIKPSNIALNSNFPSNKTYNAFNVFKKKLERTQSPLLRTSVQNNAINFMQKGKQRYVSKSPILSKGSMFNRYKMNIFSGMSNSASANSNNNNNNNKKNIKRKTPIKNNNNKKPLINGKNNVNNIRTNKGSTLIQGEFIQDSASGGHININNVNNINTVNKRNVNNKSKYEKNE